EPAVARVATTSLATGRRSDRRRRAPVPFRHRQPNGTRAALGHRRSLRGLGVGHSVGQYPEAMRHLELSVTFGLPKPERIEKHPALATLRKTTAYGNFRTNNYRRLNLLELAPPTPTETVEETIEDFNTPPNTAAGTNKDQPRAAFSETPKATPDLLEQITRLRELHDAGILTQQEYQTQKEKLLG
ncbi:MAG: SHOCT domain-containing protein, partial [Bacteroidota bacterium]